MTPRTRRSTSFTEQVSQRDRVLRSPRFYWKRRWRIWREFHCCSTLNFCVHARFLPWRRRARKGRRFLRIICWVVATVSEDGFVPLRGNVISIRSSSGRNVSFPSCRCASTRDPQVFSLLPNLDGQFGIFRGKTVLTGMKETENSQVMFCINIASSKQWKATYTFSFKKFVQKILRFYFPYLCSAVVFLLSKWF